MTHVSDHQKIESIALYKLDDGGHRVPRHYVGLDKNATLRCLGDSIGDHLFETVIGFLLLRRDLIKRGWESRRLFNDDHVQLGAEALSKVDGETESFCAPSEPSLAISSFIYTLRPSASARAKGIQKD